MAWSRLRWEYSAGHNRRFRACGHVLQARIDVPIDNTMIYPRSKEKQQAFTTQISFAGFLPGD